MFRDNCGKRNPKPNKNNTVRIIIISGFHSELIYFATNNAIAHPKIPPVSAYNPPNINRSFIVQESIFFSFKFLLNIFMTFDAILKIKTDSPSHLFKNKLYIYNAKNFCTCTRLI